MDVAQLAYASSMADNFYKCPSCHATSRIDSYDDFLKDFKCPVCHFKVDYSAPPNTTDANMDGLQTIRNDAESDLSFLAFSPLAWMIGDSMSLDSSGAIAQARMDAKSEIEAASKTPRPRTKSLTTYDDAQDEGLSAIEKARREAISEVENATRNRKS